MTSYAHQSRNGRQMSETKIKNSYWGKTLLEACLQVIIQVDDKASLQFGLWPSFYADRQPPEPCQMLRQFQYMGALRCNLVHLRALSPLSVRPAP